MNESTPATTGKTAAAGNSGNHVVPAKVFVATWVGLLVLTVVTVMVTYVDLGEINFHDAMGLATFKAALVVLIFMHLYWDKPFNALVFIASLVVLALFICFAMTDTSEYKSDQIPGYAPRIKK